MNLSPAERYIRAQSKSKFPISERFSQSFSFLLDDFQVEGCRTLEIGESVLIAAPTGSGKTIVGEFALYLALEQGKKAFYTTPIKALSNQKYQDFSEVFGFEKVGLLTGDNSINSEADIVVMTTEVLRNMLYSSSKTLENLRYVVMDEVHYLADRFRGAVWEETLIHLPESVQIAALSATVSNAEEFGEWLKLIRGNTRVIVTEKRPVPLYQQVLMGNKLLDLFVDSGKVNPQVLREERASFRGFKGDKWRDQKSIKLSRPEIIEKLSGANLLPAIVFIFSRSGCDLAVKQALSSGIRLTDKFEKEEILSLIEERTASLSENDLNVLGFSSWSDSLSRGFAAHHAGLLPLFKEIIEELFQKGLLKVVYATETLALGINMPARTVLLERLSKWNGESHVAITPGEYTQLTGRAGRRGIDEEGNAVILWSKDIDALSAAGLASTRTYPLRSSFKPTYNMAVNLIYQMGRERAKNSLGSSFAQFQADRAVVGLETQILKNNKALDSMRDEFNCHFGDFFQYAQIRYEIKESEKEMKKLNRRDQIAKEKVIENLRTDLRNHPCHQCSDREKHARQAEKYFRLKRENESLQDKISMKTKVIPRQFDEISDILSSRGYISGEKVSSAGLLLMKIYAEMDLVIAETFRSGIVDDLNPAELVGMLSIFLYEARKENPIVLPNSRLQEKISKISEIWLSIHEDEIAARINQTRSLDIGFFMGAYKWANGASLKSVLDEFEIGVGDFIRSIKQITDLLRQLQIAYPQNKERFTSCIDAINRGIISAAEDY